MFGIFRENTRLMVESVIKEHKHLPKGDLRHRANYELIKSNLVDVYNITGKDDEFLRTLKTPSDIQEAFYTLVLNRNGRKH